MNQQLKNVIATFFVIGIVASVPAAAQTTNPAAVDEASLTQEAKITLKKLDFAIKDLKSEQRQQAIPIAAEYGKLAENLEQRNREEHEATLANARKTSTPIDLKADDIKRGVRSRETYRLEATYFDRIGSEVLTPAQRITWDAYRLHMVAAFQLSFAGMDQEQNKKLAPLTIEVAKEITPNPGEDGYKLFQRRLDELKTRAAQKLLNDEQRKKLADIRTKGKELQRQIDEEEAKQGIGTPTTTPPVRDGL